MPIRIMHVVDSLGKGGLENGLVNLIQRLDSGFEHIVFAMRQLGPNANRLPEGVRLVCLGKTQASRIQVMAITAAISKFQPHIVHSRNWGAIEAVPAGRLTRSGAVVHSEHGIETAFEVNEPWRRRCFRRLAFELADRVLSVSYQLRDLHARRTGFSSRKISVIHNGVDTRQFSPNASGRARVREELRVSADEFLIGCVGNLLPVKDHLTLLKAMEPFAARVRNWRLLILGEGPERPRLDAFLAAHPQWKDRVTLAGLSNRVPELLTAMDAYVLPSLAEGISNSLLEAMATGLPVVATATGGNPEVVIDGESGFLFPVGDSSSLARLLEQLEMHRERRLELAERALGRVRKEFAIDSMVRKYAQLYEGLGSTFSTCQTMAAGV